MAAARVLTPDLMYRAAVVVALADTVFAALLWRLVAADGVRRAKWAIAAVAGVFWFGVWTAVHSLAWESVYAHVFPAWARWRGRRCSSTSRRRRRSSSRRLNSPSTAA
jgi:hypothetical protein